MNIDGGIAVCFLTLQHSNITRLNWRFKIRYVARNNREFKQLSMQRQQERVSYDLPWYYDLTEYFLGNMPEETLVYSMYILWCIVLLDGLKK